MRTQMVLDALVNELQRNCGDELAAAKAVGVSLIFVNTWRRDDPKVDAALTEAARVGTQGLVSAAIQRAVHGVEENVYYKGQVVDTRINYSDGLLQTLLKAKVPEFAKDADGGGVHVNVNVANIMPRATSYEEWLAMKDQTARAMLPAPSDEDREASIAHIMCEPATDAEYVEVQTPFAGVDL